MNGENVEKVYRQCQKRERDRERQWRKSKRYGDIRSALHFSFLDFEEAEAAEESPAWISDNGKGEEDVIAACDGGETQSDEILPEWARKKIERNLPKIALDVARLIVRHKDEVRPRRLSICEIEQWLRDASGMLPGKSTGET